MTKQSTGEQTQNQGTKTKTKKVTTKRERKTDLHIQGRKNK